MIIVRKILINGTDPNVVRKKKARNNCGNKLQKQAILLKNSLFFVVGVQGLEPWASCSQSRRATNCATPRYSIKPHYIIAFGGSFVKHFSLWSKLWVGFKNVQILEKQKPANPCAARLCGTFKKWV